MLPGKHPGITGRLLVDGGVAGAIAAVGFLTMGLIGLPLARPFFVGAAVLGTFVGLLLWWKHR